MLQQQPEGKNFDKWFGSRLSEVSVITATCFRCFGWFGGCINCRSLWLKCQSSPSPSTQAPGERDASLSPGAWVEGRGEDRLTLQATAWRKCVQSKRRWSRLPLHYFTWFCSLNSILLPFVCCTRDGRTGTNTGRFWLPRWYDELVIHLFGDITPGFPCISAPDCGQSFPPTCRSTCFPLRSTSDRMIIFSPLIRTTTTI